MTNRIVRILALAAILVSAAALAGRATAGHTPDPAGVTVAGSLQSELGCPGDWQPGCASTHLQDDPGDDVWQGVFNVPGGTWDYKAALNDSWDENYGANGVPDGANITLNAPGGDVKFYYDHKSHWITDSVSSRIVTAAGNFQSELGCPGDWQPDCLRSWLQDVDGDGAYTFVTTGLPAGNYESKAAIAEGWAESYPPSNLTFNVPNDCSTTTFSFVSSTNTFAANSIAGQCGHGQDNNVEYFGLGHNSHDTLYRVPFGSVTPGTELILRFRTYHNDVTGVRARVWDDVAGGQFFLDLTPVATDVSCYDDSQPAETCDFWQASYMPDEPTTLFYRFIVSDGTAIAHYEDDGFRDGGWGEASPDLKDWGWAIQVYDAGYEPIEWLQDAVIYQIFPDRFRNGRSNNDADINAPRYGWPDNALDRIMRKAWSDLPEGYCRHYVNPATACNEGPRGRDYFGGDIRGVQQRIDYLVSLGVTAVYFNPVFDAASNHAYDTQDYYNIDPFFGANKEFEQFLSAAEKAGIKVILDGVFNHTSSDSKYFDRYGHFAEVGACESVNSPYRSWYSFFEQAGGPCAGPNGPNTMNYPAWFGFDSLPVLDKNNQEVRDLFYGGSGSVGLYWLNKGADGWRLDVMGDGSFPAEFWQQFREAVKDAHPEAPIIGELWKKFEILPKTRGDQADTAMGYRFRNAILGFFGTVDDKGFHDDGQSDQPPSLFADKLISIREDNPDASYYTMMNILGSHDTQRILWLLTPGERNREAREFNAANVARGTDLLELAAVVQMTTPGTPTIYYGDEIGLTGDDDPDDRRTFPWGGTGPFGSGGNSQLLAHYTFLTQLREDNPVFSRGEMSFLLTDDTDRTMAYLMRTDDAAAVVAVNRSEQARTLVIDASGQLPDAVTLTDALGTVAGAVAAVDGTLTVELPGLSAAVLLPDAGQDLVAPGAPALSVEAGDRDVELNWSAVAGAGVYRIYRSPVTGGGYEFVAESSSTAYTDGGLQNAVTYHYVVTAVDAAGNEGSHSNEAAATPAFTIGWANLQWPPSMTHTISTVDRTDNAYGQVWIDGVTNQPGPTPTLIAQLGFGPDGSNPAADAGWTWVDATFNVDAGNNDEFTASLLPEMTGSFDYVFRYSTDQGIDWLYADLNGPIPSGNTPPNPGALTVNASGDTTDPAAPQNLVVMSQSPAGIELAWDAVMGDATLHGYEVLRGDSSGGPYVEIAETTATGYTDFDLVENAAYYYVVRSVDTSFNRSANSNEVAGTAELRTVTVTFNVDLPAHTPAGSTAYITGTLSRFDGGHPDWNSSSNPMAAVDANTFTITFTGLEGTQIEYKYTLGGANFFDVEKGAACEEIANRVLTLNYGANGTQTVNDAVLNWRNVEPCGN